MKLWADFWRHTDTWPRDNSLHVFLARALNRIGKAKFADAWTDVEGFVHGLMPKTEIVEPHRPRDAGNVAELARARFYEIAEKIAASAESGELLTVWRTKHGGEFREIPPEHWNTERYLQRFNMCQFRPFEPFALGSSGEYYCWIYVERSSLETLISDLEAGSNAPPRTARRLETPAQAESDLAIFYQLVSLPGKKQQMVFKAISEIWKDGRVPKAMTIGQIEERINPVVKRMGDQGGAGADNIRRALGQKKK